MNNKNSGKSAKNNIFRRSVSYLLSIIAVIAFITLVNLTTGMRDNIEGSENKIALMNAERKPDFSAESFDKNIGVYDAETTEDRLQNTDELKALQDNLSAKDEEIAGLKREISMIRSEKEVRAAGIGSIAGDIILMLLFSASLSILSAYFMKRRTRQLCHCHIRKLKIMKREKKL